MSSEGYAVAPGVVSLLRKLKEKEHLQQSKDRLRILVGVITNSDDRVPSVLSSFGLRVSPARFGTPFNAAELARRQRQGQIFDVDIHCMSYDVGVGKPDKRIFDAAVVMADELATAIVEIEAMEEGRLPPTLGPWLKIYVGDEYVNDVLGARKAGWNAVYVGSEDELPTEEQFVDAQELSHVKTLEELFCNSHNGPPTIRAKDTQKFLEWLVERCGV
jgi:FMN phosphatase YigB (HAD superfamily)